MRRTILALTPAQSHFLRRAVQSYAEENVGVRGADQKHVAVIARQNDKGTHTKQERDAIISFALSLTRQKGDQP